MNLETPQIKKKKPSSLISTAESFEEGQRDIAGGLAKFNKWEEDMQKASKEKLAEFVDYCERGMINDPLVKKHPDLKSYYSNLRRKAISLLENKGLEKIVQKFKEAKSMSPEQQMDAIENNIKDLDAAINAWEKKASDPKILKAERERLTRLIFDAKELVDLNLQ